MISTDKVLHLDNILAQFRDDARNNRDTGDRFERMMQQFFRADPLYAALFSEVWLWNEWPLKGQVGNVGIDLVAGPIARSPSFLAMRADDTDHLVDRSVGGPFLRLKHFLHRLTLVVCWHR